MQKRMKWIAIPLFVFSAVLMGVFGFMINFAPPGMSVWVISLPYFGSSFLYGAVTPLAFELAAELVFPVAEETASAWINISCVFVLFRCFN